VRKVLGVSCRHAVEKKIQDREDMPEKEERLRVNGRLKKAGSVL
jgi:hypothetical protein